MSYSTAWNYATTDTSISTETTLAIAVPVFSQDFVKRETRANEAVISNLTSPLGAVETVRFAYQRVANIYKGTGIEPAMYSPTKTGFSVLAQVNDILVVTDSDTALQTYLPFSAHLVLRGPQHAAIQGSHLVSMLQRLCSMLYEQSATSPESRLLALSRGAVLPRALF
jgi:hypothetical protein